MHTVSGQKTFEARMNLFRNQKKQNEHVLVPDKMV